MALSNDSTDKRRMQIQRGEYSTTPWEQYDPVTSAHMKAWGVSPYSWAVDSMMRDIGNGIKAGYYIGNDGKPAVYYRKGDQYRHVTLQPGQTAETAVPMDSGDARFKGGVGWRVDKGGPAGLGDFFSSMGSDFDDMVHDDDFWKVAAVAVGAPLAVSALAPAAAAGTATGSGAAAGTAGATAAGTTAGTTAAGAAGTGVAAGAPVFSGGTVAAAGGAGAAPVITAAGSGTAATAAGATAAGAGFGLSQYAVPAALGGYGLYEGSQNRKQAAQAMSLQEQQMEAQLGLQREQLAMAREDRDYKRDVYDQMVADARVDPGTYGLMTGRAASDVVKSFDAVRGARQREMMRYGLNPASGRFQAEENANAMNQAAAVAGAKNNTRLGLRNFEKTALMSARSAGLGLQNPMMPVMSEIAATHGAHARQFGDAAAGYNQAAGQAVSSGLSSAGMMLGYGLRPQTPAGATPAPSIAPSNANTWSYGDRQFSA